MTRHLLISAALVACWGVCPQSSAAPITYVDATYGVGGNTTQANGNPFTPTANSASGTGTDNQWRERPFGNGVTIFAANDVGGAAEDAPALKTTIGSLQAGSTYNVFAYFWDDGLGNSNWRLKASVTTLPPLGDNASVSFSGAGSATSTNANPAAAGDFAVAPIVGEGTVGSTSFRTLHQANLGVAVADGSGNIIVYIDDLAFPSQNERERTWYDGVGFSLVPEPSGALLAMSATAGMSLFRRRRTSFQND